MQKNVLGRPGTPDTIDGNKIPPLYIREEKKKEGVSMLEEHREYRIFGPPGTGKTTFLKTQVTREVEVYGEESVMICSLTRTAANEIAGRDFPIPRDAIGTLHSMAYRSLDQPLLVETSKMFLEWNKAHPSYSLSEAVACDIDDFCGEQGEEKAGDRLFNAYKMLRNRMIPREAWPVSVVSFAQAWESWKAEVAGIDFADMISMAIDYIPCAPGDPEVLLVDEVQDLPPLGMTLVRKWGDRCQRFFLAGDDDQCLYQWTGATPNLFLNPPVPDTRKRVLSQSYRVPAVIHQLSQQWIRQLSVREEKEYAPRSEQGCLASSSANYRSPELIVQEALDHTENGRSVMFLASCSYMLEPVVAVLREEGIPFHNPYRRRRGDWNPLGPRAGVSAVDRILTFLRPDNKVWGSKARMWSVDDIRILSDVIKAEGVFRRGAKTEIETYRSAKQEASLDELTRWFTDEALFGLMDIDLDWFERNLIPSKAKGFVFPLKVYRKRGITALTQRPRIVVGTIHSVKGGEADVVYLFPDLSKAGYLNWIQPGELRDSVIRLFYVGMTRARNTLVVCSPATNLNVQIV